MAASPMVEGDIEDTVVVLGRLDHESSGFGVLGHRLLGEHVHAGIQRRHCYRSVQGGRYRDAQQIKLLMINKILPVCVAVLLRDAVRRCKGLQRVSFQSRQCHKINISSHPRTPPCAAARPIRVRSHRHVADL